MKTKSLINIYGKQDILLFNPDLKTIIFEVVLIAEFLIIPRNPIACCILISTLQLCSVV